MFSNKKNGMRGSDGGGGTARRVITSILETSGLVCGSLKDTIEDKLTDNEIDMKWVESEIYKLGHKMEKPKEHILNYADKACRGGAEPTSPDFPVPGVMGANSSDDNTLEDTVTASLENKTRASTVEFDDDTTLASEALTAETPPKKSSRFAQVVVDEKKRENEKKMREKAAADAMAAQRAAGGGIVVIGLCLSRKNSILGHPDTVTRQTAFDFNELQDRDYEYVSSTDDSGWLAGGGERGDPYFSGVENQSEHTGSPLSSKSDDSDAKKFRSNGAGHKIAAPDRVHIPIIQINAANSAVIDEIVAALANGEIFIPEVSVLPETLSVNSTSPPDLVVRFECEKNDDTPPEEWPNWGLEFLHNQLFDFFSPMGARWSKRPFQITLARKVRWMTVKHMNKYFARSEQVINSWREKGPQYLQPPYSDDSSRGVILEEITKPHGIYLIQNGVPTNYFAPNFQPPYTTKLRRSLIRNVINKSWDAQHRDWLSKPVPSLRGPVQLLSSVMGCSNPSHTSPVEDKAIAHNLGAFHMRPDFDLVVDSRDMSRLPELLEQAEGRSKRNNDKKNTGAGPSEKQHHNDLLCSRPEDEGKELDMKPTASTTSIPSDESQSRPRLDPSGTLEETMTDASCTDTNNGEHSEKLWCEFSPDKSSQDDAEQISSRGRTLPSGSSKDVSFSDYSVTENELERILDREKHRRLPTLTVDASFNTDKFAKTKVQTKRREMRDRRQDENVERNTPTAKTPSNSRRSYSPQMSPSCESMAYSLDSNPLQLHHPFAYTNINDGGASVMTSGTENQSLISYVTRSTMVHSRYQEENSENARTHNGEGDDISLSLLESRSSVLPDDDELFAIGWAKALDANTGIYYYFTLDRTKTVWENPLATSP